MNLILIRAGFPPAIIQQKYRMEYISAMREVNIGDYTQIRKIIINEERRALDRYLILTEKWAKQASQSF